MPPPYRWPGTVLVHDQQVPIPGPGEQSDPAWTLESVQADNADEHEAGRHGPDCPGDCAERTYARWSGLLNTELVAA
ncbi:hypothetical protein ACG83_10495 [Frankia sp. R43]|uniref:hypothetical protein n=1 Tax=Frankia sp. R43 TaxID=269536 RepID=UPI0006CA06B3|nr:hypothetical protein [Frankia sp. R43]KPM55703.1 hypothetical protein ACG83_10495 [Frankia sp. R43]